jgi:Tfp pilus assembly protein PilV
MRRLNRKGAGARGLSLIEAAITTCVVSVALCGLVASLNTARQLEVRSRQLSRASSTLSGRIEQMRMDASDGWSRLPTDYDGTNVQVAGSATSVKATMRTTVSSATTGLTDPSGMWEVGATVPNYYFIDVTADVTGSGMAPLRFQTYITDRDRISAPVGASGGSSSSPPPPPPPPPTPDPTEEPSPQAEQISTTPVSVTTGGKNGISLKAELRNEGSTPVTVTRVVVTTLLGAELKHVNVAGTTLLNTKNSLGLSFDTGDLTTPITVDAGTFQVGVKDIVPESKLTLPEMRNVSITFTMGDGSQRTVLVQP